MKSARHLSVSLALAALLALTGCGSTTANKPNTTAAANTLPHRIVSLSPSATETLFAIGAGAQVVATDEYSTYPKNAPTTKLSGFDPNVEAIAGYHPDLVVLASDTNGIVASLNKLHIKTLVSPAPASIEQGYADVAVLGQKTGHVAETTALVTRMRSQIKAIVQNAPKRPVRIYHELDNTYFAASSKSFIGSVYTALGATNIADPADRAKSGYPQLTSESIVKADPQLIVITSQVSYTAKDVAHRPGWGGISAVMHHHIVTVNADIASRWGPRLPQLMQQLARAIASVK